MPIRNFGNTKTKDKIDLKEVISSHSQSIHQRVSINEVYFKNWFFFPAYNVRPHLDIYDKAYLSPLVNSGIIATVRGP